METTDIILVTENNKGSETNTLMGLMDYIDFMEKESWLSLKETAEDMAVLGRTLMDREKWMESYFAANRSISARYCADERQLSDFLQGRYNTDREWVFDGLRCSKECLDHLNVLDMDTDGRRKGSAMHYEKMEGGFKPGEILHNFNNNDYRVMECLSKRNLLLMDVNTGNFVVAVGTERYRRIPKQMEGEGKSGAAGVEWGHGHYLAAAPSGIDFRMLKQEYGTPEKIRDLHDYRSHLQKQFDFLDTLSADRLATRGVRKAAAEAVLEKFGTDRREAFLHNLSAGRYDGRFTRRERQKGGR